MIRQIVEQIVLVSALAVGMGCQKSGDTSELTDKDIGSEQFYAFANDLKCTETAVMASQSNKAVSFLDLKSDSPRILTDNGTYPMKKLAEDEELVTISWVTPSGSMDSYIIDKKKGTFAHAALGKVVNLYTTASVGKCK